MLTGTHILLGITGSIAAYKTPDLVRRLNDQQAQVRVVMTKAATQFITPLSLQAVSGHCVYTAWLDADTEATMSHITLARWADVVLIAPASANFLARLTYGFAENLLSTLCLATIAPIAVAPAMNQQMWEAPITQENIQRLQQRGIICFGPVVGQQACGETGAGRMLEPLDIVIQLQTLLSTQSLKGRRILITAGPTRENLDAVRFISNRSSGKMGYALAQAAYQAGAHVTLISGPVALSPPIGVDTVSIYSAQEMFNAVMATVAEADIFIATAAVADYRPSQQVSHKIKKQMASLTIPLERTTDILATVADLPNPPFTVGFAAETHHVMEYARDKLQRKKLNMIVANQVGVEGVGFESEENAAWVLWADQEIVLPQCTKKLLAEQLIAIISQRYQSRSVESNSLFRSE